MEKLDSNSERMNRIQRFVEEKIDRGHREMAECLQAVCGDQKPTFESIEDVIHRQLDIVAEGRRLLEDLEPFDTCLAYLVETFEDSVERFEIIIKHELQSRHEDVGMQRKSLTKAAYVT